MYANLAGRDDRRVVKDAPVSGGIGQQDSHEGSIDLGREGVSNNDLNTCNHIGVCVQK